MVKLQESKNRYSVTIPKNYIRVLGWEKGDEILITMNEDDDLVLKEVEE